MIGADSGADHAAELDLALPKVPVLFNKNPNTFIGHKGKVIAPKNIDYMNYENELVVVIGQRIGGGEGEAGVDQRGDDGFADAEHQRQRHRVGDRQRPQIDLDRAAGEVAPLMLVGVVKLAPSLPLDGNFPFLHLDRKFMHLGFHIYDIGFQSPNVEAAKPMVFVTTLLLVLIVLTMSSVAIHLRNKMKKRYTFGTF